MESKYNFYSLTLNALYGKNHKQIIQVIYKDKEKKVK